MTAQAHRAKPSFNDFKKSQANIEPPEKELGLDWDAIKTAYEARLDWEEANGLNPVERRQGVEKSETEKSESAPETVKQSVKPPRKKPGPKPKKRVEPEPGPKTNRKVDLERVLELHKQGMSNAQISRELGVSPQAISWNLNREFNIYTKTRSDLCGAGLHSMAEHGRQQYVTKPDGTKVKDGRSCMACRRQRDEDKKAS